MSDKISDDLALYSSQLLSSVLLRAYEEPRRWLYIWEKNLLLAVHAYREAGGECPLDSWTVHFLELNLDAIKNDREVDFNLRADTLRRAALSGKE
jgi:hypothetical protein